MHSLHVNNQQFNQRVSPANFMPFDFGTITSAVAFDETHRWLWCNDAAAKSVASMEGRTGPSPSPESLRGISSRKLFGDAYMEERMDFLQGVLETGAPTQYVEFTWGHRVRTRVWELDPDAYGRRGWFALVQPENIRAATSQGLMPMLVSSQLGPLSALTTRELVVMRLVALGMSAKEVARHEFRSTKTIENQLGGIHAKLGLTNRAELVRLACERGVIAFSNEEWNQIAAGHRPATTLSVSLAEDASIIGSIPISTGTSAVRAEDRAKSSPIVVA